MDVGWDRYKTLDRLNEAWGTVFRNQTYIEWEQIYVPRPVLNMGINPHQHLDYITTNGMFGNLDNHLMEKECLDVYVYGIQIFELLFAYFIADIYVKELINMSLLSSLNSQS